MIAKMRNIPKWFLAKNGKKSKNSLELVKLFGLAVTTIVVFTFAIALIQLKSYADEIPTKFKIDQILKNKGENSKIYDKHGKLLYIFKDPIQDREYAEFKEIPATIIAAALAAEDEEFFLHQGIDYLATAKAAVTTISSGGSVTIGGSTITQQLVKQTLLTSERSLDRKAKEAIISLMVENGYSKEQILEFYLNTTSYGGRVIGIKTAARTYFQKDLNELTLNEAAFLIGLVQSPGEYSPLFSANKEQAKKLSDNRRKYVLRQISENSQLLAYLNQGNIGLLKIDSIYWSPAETASARFNKYTTEKVLALNATGVKFKRSVDFIRAPHFVFYIRDILQTKPYNLSLSELYSGGYQIYTSLDYGMQKIAEVKLRQGVDTYGPAHGFTNGALVSIDARTGEILTMVGSKGYSLRKQKYKRFDPKVNVAIARQSLGSSLKPWVAYLGFETNSFTPYSIVADTPHTFPGGYRPKNSDGRFFGMMTVSQALLLSRNLPMLRMLNTIGDWRLAKLMPELGYQKKNNYGLAAAIGGVDETLLDHVGAYTGFANGGKVLRKVPILRIKDPSGKVIFKAKKGSVLKQLDQRSVSEVNGILGDKSFSSGAYGWKFIGGQQLGGKTGTSDNNRDTYYIGYGPKIVTGIWSGNNDNSPLSGSAFGVTTSLPIWNSYMSAIFAAYPEYSTYGSY
jgi:penicillin-binding protein 1A